MILLKSISGVCYTVMGFTVISDADVNYPLISEFTVNSHIISEELKNKHNLLYSLTPFITLIIRSSNLKLLF